MNYLEKKSTYDRAKIIAKSDLSWSDKHGLIFSDDILMKFDFEWYDPNLYDPYCDYEQDIMSFMSAFGNHIENELTVFNQINNIENNGLR